MREARYDADGGSGGVVQAHGAAPGKRTRTESLPARGGGEPLAGPVRDTMERSFGVDLAPVRVHQDGAASAMGAEAFAQGTDIHMAPGRYDPGSTSGRELIGHEVAHVVQQSQGRVSASRQFKGAAINDDPALEAEADQQGARAGRGEPATSGGGSLLGGPLPALQTVVNAPRQGYFTHRNHELSDEHRDAISAYLHGRPRVRDEADDFDTMSKNKKDEGSVADWLKANGIGHSVAKILDGRASAEDEDDGGGADGSDTEEEEAGHNGARLDGYDSDNIPDRGDRLGLHKIWSNKKKKQEAHVPEFKLSDTGFSLASSIRTFRGFESYVPDEESKQHTPMLSRMGSQFLLFAPTPARKDAAVTPMRRSESGNHLERDGQVKPNKQLATALEADCTRNGLSHDEMKANIRHLFEVNKDAKEDLPHPVDADCIRNLRELVAIWVVDQARASRTAELIGSQALGDGTFMDILAGSNPSYVGAPPGGSSVLQEYTASQKKKESGDEAAS